MAAPMLIIVCWAFALLITALGLFSFIRGCIQIGRVIAAGRPVHGRGRPIWRRTWAMLSAIFSHRQFKGRPVIRVAHWIVMMSFPLLFFTLITGYAQLRDQTWQIPWLGHQVWWGWLTEFFAWAGLLAIIALMAVRTRATRRASTDPAAPSTAPSPDTSAAEAESSLNPTALSAINPKDTKRAHQQSRKRDGSPDESPPQPATRTGVPAARTSRFLGSTRWQARFVEWVILLVCACVIVLRGLDYALLSTTGPADPSWVSFPLTFWIGALLVDPSQAATAVQSAAQAVTDAATQAAQSGAPDAASAATEIATQAVQAAQSGAEAAAQSGAEATTATVATPTQTALANAIVVFSTLKIAVSMLWMVMVGIQPTMGVAWHRFLAIFNLYTRRHPDGSKALGGANPLLLASASDKDTPSGPANPDNANTAPADSHSTKGTSKNTAANTPLRATPTPPTNGDPVTDPDQLPDDAHLGALETGDLTWKDRLDFFTCTECGRCQEVCPAWNTGKPLSPKLLILALRDHVQSASVMAVGQREVVDGEVKGATTAAELAADGGILMDKELEFSPHSRDVLQALSTSHATGPAGVLETEGTLVPGVISPDVLWSCTMCGACVDACPVDIEHIDHILDLRRGQVLMAGSMPRELTKPMRGLQMKQNPYNQAARKRLDWTKHCPVKVPVIGQDVESAADVDYLFWVGSAGTFDDRARKTSSAVAELLTIAGVSFAVLGPAETSSGDTARRIGDEVTFLTLAHQAIDTLHEVQATKILVTSPHIFNVMTNEYPQLGGHFEVIHHTQLLAQLIRQGRLTTGATSPNLPSGVSPVIPVDEASTSALAHPSSPGTGAPGPVRTNVDSDRSKKLGNNKLAHNKHGSGHFGDQKSAGAQASLISPEAGSKLVEAGSGSAKGGLLANNRTSGARGGVQTVTYHDPCFLGRHNGEFEAPRDILRALPGVKLVEMPRCRQTAMCCGAGGGRAWMEEKSGVRIADARMAEAAGTGAAIVATACPLCTQMLGAATGTSLPKPAQTSSNEEMNATPQPAPMPEVRDIALMLLDAVKRANH